MFQRNRARLALLIGAVAMVLAACQTTPPPPGTTFDLNVTVTVTDGGTVVSTPAGIDTSDTDTAKFAEGASVSLKATPATGFKFDGWTGACETEATDTCVVAMTGNRNVGALFSAVIVDPQEITLTVTFQGDGTGTVTSGDNAVDCTATCDVTFLEGDAVTLTATADAGSTFLAWGGGTCTGTDACGPLVLTEDTSVTALFALDSSFETFSVRITDGDDDAEEFVLDVNATNVAGQVTNTSSDLDLAYDSAVGYPDGSIASPVYVGLRFPGVTVPAGAVILSATIQFQSTTATSAATDLIFHGEADVAPEQYPHDAAAVPSSDISSRATTTASATWSAPAFASQTKYESIDLSGIVSEIVDLDGWASGNAMAFVVTGPDGQTGFRLTHSANSGTADSAPFLTINYYVPN